MDKPTTCRHCGERIWRCAGTWIHRMTYLAQCTLRTNAEPKETSDADE